MNRVPRLIVAAAAIGVFAAGCATASRPAYDDLVPTIVAFETEPETTPEVTAALPEPIEPNNCIECHSDAELLQQLAVEEEVAPSLSEGSG